MNKSDMTADEWKEAVWEAETKEIQNWVHELMHPNGCRDIRIMVPENCDVTTTIISDVECGDAYVITTNPTAATLEEAVQGRWYPDTVTKAISELYQSSKITK